MKTYKIYKTIPDNKDAAYFVNENGSTTSFVFDSANTDYQTFKKEINEGTAQLEDADGNLMTEQQAKDFVATLP